MTELVRRKQPVSRRNRPAKAPLSREAIVGAALELVEGDGHLTLRRLASALDMGPASVYVYFRDTEELYAGILDELLGRLPMRRGRKPWRERLTALLIAYTELLYAHPTLARTALVTRPNGANSLKLWEALLRLLHDAGISRADAAWAADLLLQRATATAAELGARAGTAGAEAEDERTAEALADISPRTHPHLAASANELLSGPAEARLRWGFDVLINGVLATPRPDRDRVKATEDGLG